MGSCCESWRWDGRIIPLGDADCTPLVDVNQYMWNWDRKKDCQERKKKVVTATAETVGKGKEVEKQRESVGQTEFNLSRTYSAIISKGFSK